MKNTLQFDFIVDKEKNTITVKREFAANRKLVWDCHTKSELLDKWFAPKPFTTKSKSMDFREGGRWFYYMQGHEDVRHYCRVDYKSNTPNKLFTGDDVFCDEKGNISTELPTMHWEVRFNPIAYGTRVEIEINLDSEADMEKIVEMGFKEGFAAAHNNLDELLSS